MNNLFHLNERRIITLFLLKLHGENSSQTIYFKNKEEYEKTKLKILDLTNESYSWCRYLEEGKIEIKANEYKEEDYFPNKKKA